MTLKLLADLGYRLALTGQDVGLARLVNNRFRRKPLFWHGPLPSVPLLLGNIRLDQLFQAKSSASILL